MQARLFGREWELTEGIGPYRDFLEVGGRDEFERLGRFLADIIDEGSRRDWDRHWKRSHAVTVESLIQVVTAIIEHASGVEATTFARIGTYAFQDHTWRSMRGQLRVQGVEVEDLKIGEFVDVAWAQISTMYSGWDSPFEFQQKLYDWFFRGVEPKSKGKGSTSNASRTVRQSDIQEMMRLNEMLQQRTPAAAG